MGAQEWGEGYGMTIHINSNKIWTDNADLVTPTHWYDDIYTVFVHEMGHIFGASHAPSTSLSVMYYSNLNVRRSLTSCDQATVRNVYNPERSLTITNSFGPGTVRIYDRSNNAALRTTPYPLVARENTWPWNAEAIDQEANIGGTVYMMRFANNWTGPDFSPTERTVELPKRNGTYTAQFLKEFNISFQNNFVGVGNAGVMTVNSTQYNLPHSSFPVVQNNSITASAGSQGYNGIEYVFDHWSDSYPYSYRTITPGDHATYTAYFVGRPLQMWQYGLHGNSTVGDPITLYWDVHPNFYVTQYQIWRKVRHNGVTGSPYLLATLDRNTTTYIDWDYMISNGNWDLVSYDVRPYYSVEQTYADPWWLAFFGSIMPKQIANPVPTAFALENYPNPFNPVTRINFDLPEGANVSLVVYDIVGRKIAELASGYHEAGYYSAAWGAMSESGVTVSSGVYFARFTATRASGEVAFTKITKLLLMK